MKHYVHYVALKNRQSSSAVEQRTHKPLVGGPNPLSGTISKPAILLELRASFVESTSTNGRNNVCGGYKKKSGEPFWLPLSGVVVFYLSAFGLYDTVRSESSFAIAASPPFSGIII